jgi:CBS domain containing-hemolysin-like protein
VTAPIPAAGGGCWRIDEPLGIVARKDLLAQLLDGQTLDVMAALRQPLVLPEGMTVLKALELSASKPLTWLLW